jgi:hypothetical protein
MGAGGGAGGDIVESWRRSVSADYEVGTSAESIEVVLCGGVRIVGEIFLRPGQSRGAESVADRLNDRDPFFPVKQDESVLLVSKAQVRYVVTPPLDDEDPTAEQRPSLPQLLVTAEMDDGEQITGVFFIDLPPGQVRALDYVNGTRRAFLPLAQLDREYLIHRQYVRFIRDVQT